MIEELNEVYLSRVMGKMVPWSSITLFNRYVVSVKGKAVDFYMMLPGMFGRFFGK